MYILTYIHIRSCFQSHILKKKVQLSDAFPAFLHDEVDPSSTRPSSRGLNSNGATAMSPTKMGRPDRNGDLVIHSYKWKVMETASVGTSCTVVKTASRSTYSCWKSCCFSAVVFLCF